MIDGLHSAGPRPAENVKGRTSAWIVFSRFCSRRGSLRVVE
jgi:hypothetical protein